MNPFFAYLIKSSVSIALFYIVFKLSVSRDKMHSVNRFVLLGILIGSALIPFADIPVLHETPVISRVEVFRELVATPFFFAEPVLGSIQPAPETKSVHINLYLVFYLFIISALFIRLLVSSIRVIQIINSAEKKPFRKIVLAIVKDFIQPFTFLKHIIISEKDFTENKEIIVAHEYAHIKHLHAIDLLICELFTALHWFNPFMWFLRRDLKLIHEFQADQAVLNKGIDATQYQLLVLEKSVGERRFAMANHFTQKPILKRIKMMQKKNKKQWTWVKIVFFVPALILLLQAFARPELITKADDFIPVTIQEDQKAKWVEKWTFENIGNGFFQPELKDIDAPRKSNNVLVILMNRRNELLIENQYAKKEDVKRIVKEFLNGKTTDGKKGPDFIETEILSLGKVKVSQGFMSFYSDLATSKDEMDLILRKIGEACLEVRKEKARFLFDKDYFDLDEEKQEAVNMSVPVWFSIEKPKTVKPPPPKVIGIIPQKGKIPFITFQNTWINVNGESCEFEQMNEILEKALPVDGTQRQVELIVNSVTSKDRVEQVYNELERINDLEIIKKMAPPLPPPKFTLKLYNDKVTLWDNEIKMDEVHAKAKEFVSKAGKNAVVRVDIENNINAERINLLKEELRKAKAHNVQIRTMK